MLIKQAMWDKASRCIAQDSAVAYKSAGNVPGKKHKPYSIPQRAQDLVEALGKDDAERVAAIMLYQY